MSHLINITDINRNPDLFDSIGEFLEDRPEGHVCDLACHEIGGEPESPEMYGAGDDEDSGDPGDFDGGYGPNSYFQHAMSKDD